MADLASKLAMRRKGISGKQRESTTDTNSTLGKMSHMIAAITKDDDDDEQETFQDDDDDDDWN